MKTTIGRRRAAAAACVILLGMPGRVRGSEAATGASEDTTGMGLVEWSYDTWTVPWVQVRGDAPLLAPGSHATLMALTCATSVLERDRRVRHLSAEECEHHMAAIRADQDTALVFRVDLRVFPRPGSHELAGLGRRVSVVLEGDEGWRWSPVGVGHGAGLGMATSGKVMRIPVYSPQWMRGSGSVRTSSHDRGGQGEFSERWVRFPRTDPRTGGRLLTTATRWLRLRLTYQDNEWVATWPFLPEGELAR